MPQGPRAVAETEARKVKPKCGTERLVGTIPGESLQGFHKPWQGGLMEQSTCLFKDHGAKGTGSWWRGRQSL